MKKAWIENNVVRDICPGNPAECYHSDIAGHYDTDVPDGTEPGATLVNGIWVNPAPAIPPVPITPDKTVTPVEFKILWTVQERIAITGMKATDPVVADLMGIMDDPRLQIVNLSLQSTQQTVDYLLSKLVAATVLTEADVPVRRAAILSGKFQ